MRGLRSTHTYVQMHVSQATFDEISAKLLDAGYDHAFMREDDETTLDMHGIGLVVQADDRASEHEQVETEGGPCTS